LLVQNRFSKGKDTSLQDIQDVFQKPPYDLSEGTVINYLEELVNNRKLSTWKVKNRRYYGPPKIPFSIKVGIASSVIIILLSIMIDTLVSTNIIYQYIYFGYFNGDVTPSHYSMFPLTVYLLIIVVFLTAVWYLSNRKIYK
jgi:hypothetical protein